MHERVQTSAQNLSKKRSDKKGSSPCMSVKLTSSQHNRNLQQYHMVYLFVGRLRPQRFTMHTNRKNVSKYGWVFHRKSKEDHLRTSFKVKFQKFHKCRIVYLIVQTMLCRFCNAHQLKECVKVQVGLPQKIQKRYLWTLSR